MAEILSINQILQDPTPEEAQTYLNQIFQPQKQNSERQKQCPPSITGLPKKMKDCTLKNFNYSSDRVPVEYGQTCYNFAKDKLAENCLLLCGNVGNGKSHLAVATLKNVPGKCLFMLATDFFENLNYAATHQENKMNLLRNYINNYDAFCIDGLERANFNDTAKENMYLLIHLAYYEVRKLIITTNFSFEAFRDIDGRIYSRLYEMSVRLPFNWDDYRLKI